MAAGPSSLDNYLSCQICFEHFEVEGDHVPRILPCFHTLCEKCITGMIREGKLTCPECREEHQAGNREKSFQQNPYILAQIGKVKLDVKVHDPIASVICPEHDKELVLFCEEEDCKKPICVSCLTKEHRNHNFVEIEEKKKEVVQENIKMTQKDLRQKVFALSKAKDDVREKTVKTVNDLKKTMEEMNKKLGNMIRETEMKMKDANTRIDADVAMINEHIALLEQMKVNINADKKVTIKTLVDAKDTVAEVVDTIKVNICGNKVFEYHSFQANQDISFGRFASGVVKMFLPEIVTHDATQAAAADLPIVNKAYELKWKGKIVIQVISYKSLVKATSCARHVCPD